MAQVNVLDTTELLEAILCRLPCKDLLFAQKVCRSWRATINGSVKLQKALFLAGTHLPLADTGSSSEFDEDGFHINALEHFAFVAGPSSTGLEICKVGENFESVLLNPMIQQLCKQERQAGTSAIAIFCYDGEDQRSSGPRSSWKKMLLTQPPLREMEWYLWPVLNTDTSSQTERLHSTTVFTVMNKTGVTMQDLIDALKEMCEFEGKGSITFAVGHSRLQQ